MSVNGFEVIPSAKRLIRSLRDMGYEFAAAVADLIDNSIEARANTVRVDVVWNGESSNVVISDNGNGMSAAELREAMRYGADRDYDTDDLGKFGLGLKTASMSQCCRLTVASRQNPSRADINAYCWDLDHIEATNRWEILPIATTSLPAAVRRHLKETMGTVVIWDRLDRILDYKKPDGEMARKQMFTICREIEEHLAMVFHRFLAGEVRGKKLAIYVNNNKVVPWDPFARQEPATKKLDAVVFKVDGGATKSDVVLEPYVLPPQSKFSSPEAHARASGPNKWNRQQGFYIYRADRMIQSGGWSNIRTLDEHLKLARVAVFFSPKLDEAFKINVPKMRVSLPVSIRDAVTKAIAPVLSLANMEYRKGEKVGTGVPRPPVVTPTPNPGTAGDKPTTPVTPPTAGISLPGAVGGPSVQSPHGDTSGVNLDQVGALLEGIATPAELPVVRSVLKRAREKFGASIYVTAQRK